MGVRSAERMLRKWGAERVEGVTLQWLFNLYEWGQRQQRRQREAIEVHATVDAAKMTAATVEEGATIDAMGVEAERAATVAEVSEKAAKIANVSEEMKRMFG